jgi:hypothetical protein
MVYFVANITKASVRLVLLGGYFSGKAVQTIAGKGRSKTVEKTLFHKYRQAKTTLFYKNKALETTLFLFLENSSL